MLLSVILLSFLFKFVLFMHLAVMNKGAVINRSAPKERSSHFVLSADALRTKGARGLGYVGSLV